MNLNRPLIQTEDCSPTWLEMSAMQAAGLRVLQQILANILFRRRTNCKKSRLCRGQRAVSATFVFIGDLRLTSGEPGFYTEVCSFTDDVILFFCFLKDGITSCITKSESTKQKHFVCVSSLASERRVEYDSVWNDVTPGILCLNSQSINCS